MPATPSTSAPHRRPGGTSGPDRPAAGCSASGSDGRRAGLSAPCRGCGGRRCWGERRRRARERVEALRFQVVTWRIMPMPFDTAYLVCATPRSGSTLLCETLRATGIAGNPHEHFEVFRHSSQPRQPREYFDGVSDPEVLGLLSPLDPPRSDPEPAAAWWGRIAQAGATPNGVWGGKLMWGHVPDLLAR